MWLAKRVLLFTQRAEWICGFLGLTSEGWHIILLFDEGLFAYCRQWGWGNRGKANAHSGHALWVFLLGRTQNLGGLPKARSSALVFERIYAAIYDLHVGILHMHGMVGDQSLAS